MKILLLYKKKFLTYREKTKPSGEQPTIFQVQGSTEFKSQPFITPDSSLISFFTAINAATESTNQPSKQKERNETQTNSN